MAILYLPAESIVEFLSTGAIDLQAVGRGRPYPVWMLYLIGWASALFLTPTVIGPIVWNYVTGFRVVMSETSIKCRSVTIDFKDIESVGRVGFLNRLRVSAKSGYHMTIPAVLGKHATDEIESRLDSLVD